MRDYHELLKKIDVQLVEDGESFAKRKHKCGANLKQQGELEEWLQLQTHMKLARTDSGGNIFTYKT